MDLVDGGEEDSVETGSEIAICEIWIGRSLSYFYSTKKLHGLVWLTFGLNSHVTSHMTTSCDQTRHVIFLGCAADQGPNIKASDSRVF